MTPSELPDPALEMIHNGAAPLFHKDRPRYYHRVAELIHPWREFTMAMVQAAVKDAQYRATRGGPADASKHLSMQPVAG